MSGAPVPGGTPARPDDDAPPRAQRLGAVLWPSFFAAGVATMVFFAFVDPLALKQMTFPRLSVTRELGYTIGFFLFWSATAASSLFTSLLLYGARQVNRPLPDDED